MLELFQSGGWLMLPILGCSVIALVVCFERLWILRSSYVAPHSLLPLVEQRLLDEHGVGRKLLEDLAKWPLGKILSSGLIKWTQGIDAAKTAMEETASQVTFDLERHLTILGTVASIAPLLGLLGTVVGMIQVFTTLVTAGGGDPTLLAGGISEALITTAAGLSVAIVALICHRYFQRRVDKLVVQMEQQANMFVNVLLSIGDLPVEE